MSIYSSWLWLGKSTIPEEDTPTEARPRVYRGSHVYPNARHAVAFLDTGSIPHWCIPGHNDAGTDPTCSTCGTSLHDTNANAPWLRLMVGGNEGNYTVVIPAAGVERLRDHLTEWLGSVWGADE